MRGFETLGYDLTDGVATITLNRPEQHNAFNVTLTHELHDLWRDLRWDRDVRAIVLTGAGEKAFCTGIDRNDTIPQPDAPWMMDDPGLLLGPKSSDLWKPVIAAVNGMACGGAFYMLGECETIIAAEHATFFDPHVTYGMTAAFEPALMLPRMPFGEIMRLSLLGNYERLSAARALQIGLVQEVTPSADLLDRAHDVAAKIASSPSLAVQGTVRSIWLAREMSRSQALAMARIYIGLGSDMESIGEGQQRFQSGQRIEWNLR